MQLLLVISVSGAVPRHRQWLEVRKWLQEKNAQKKTESRGVNTLTQTRFQISNKFRVNFSDFL